MNYQNEYVNKTISKSPKPVKFVIKLLALLEEDYSKGIIKWNKKGNIIEILDVHSLTNKLLPLIFKHSNLSNFIRQLNMYNFKKIRNRNYERERLESEYLEEIYKTNKDEEGEYIGYYNKYFLRDDHSKVHLIRRNNKLNFPKKISISNDNKSYHINNDIKERDIIEKLFILDWKSKELEELKQEKYIEYNSLLNKQNDLNGYLIKLEGLIYVMIKSIFNTKVNSIKINTFEIEKMIEVELDNVNFVMKIKEIINSIEEKNKYEKSNINKGKVDNSESVNVNFTQSHSFVKGMSFKNWNENENVLKLNSNLSITNPFSSFRYLFDKMKRKDENEEDYFKLCEESEEEKII